MDRELLGRLMPAAPTDTIAFWARPLAAAMDAFDIDTPQRQAGFLASIANETGQLKRFVEQSYYWTPYERMAIVFGRRTPPLEKIVEWRTLGPERFDLEFFNWVYDDRRGATLGNTQDGDGYRYRGMGPGQITGRGNCEEIGRKIGVDLVADPTQLLKPDVGSLAFACYWRDRGNNQRMDRGEVLQAMKVMNPGLYSFDNHLDQYRRILQVLIETPKLPPATTTQAVVQAATGKTGAAAIAGAAATTVSVADALTKVNEATTLATAGRTFLGIYGLPAQAIGIVLGIVTVACIGYCLWRYSKKLLRGQAVSS